MANVKKTVRRKREKKNVPAGAVHIRSSFNNTMVTVTDQQGNALASVSAAARSPLRSQPRRLPKPRQRPPWSMV